MESMWLNNWHNIMIQSFTSAPFLNGGGGDGYKEIDKFYLIFQGNIGCMLVAMFGFDLPNKC